MDCLVHQFCQKLRYLLSFNNFVKKLEQEEGDLILTRDDVQNSVEHVKRKSRETSELVNKWLQDAMSDIGKVNQLLEEARTKNMRCFGYCPNWIWRYRIGKKVANKVYDLEKFIDEGKKYVSFDRIPTISSGTLHILLEKFMDFESRQSIYEQILDAVKNNDVSMIGLYGMGGCGKTTLAMEIRKLVEAEHLFEKVLFVPVSSTMDVQKIQGKIASSLQFQFAETEEIQRAQILCLRLIREKNIFIILDDVWEKLDFGRIGIPSSEHHKGCKILITSRSEAVCSSMDCQRKIYLPILTDEEAWTLFQNKALITEATSDTLKDLGRLISKECKGLPVSIAAVACSLKGKAETVWSVALNKLRRSKPINIESGLIDPYYDWLQLSYDNLDDKEAKSLFLLCSVFPEDSDIPVEILTRCAIGLGVVGEAHSYEEARSKVIAAKIKLVSCCLLLDADHECVKMHDIVRDVVHIIAQNENTMIKCELEKDVTVEQNSVRYLWCAKISKDLDCSNLEFLCLRTKMKEFDGIFKRMRMLKVLIIDNDGDGKTPLPTISFKTLTNLRRLSICNCELSDFSFLSSMKNLQSLELYYCLLPSFPELQADVAITLTTLKLLELNECDAKVKNFEVMKRIPLLEELYIIDIKGKYIEFFKTFSIPETLQRYGIVLGSHNFDHYNDGDIYIDGRTLLLNHFDISNEVIKGLAKEAKDLYVGNIHGEAKNIIPDIFQIEGGGLNELSKLEIRDSAGIECLIDTRSHSSEVVTLFSKLHTLKIDNMENLKAIWHCFLPANGPFENLEKLYLSDCPRLTLLFTYEVARNLVKLKILRVSRCDELKHVLTYDEKSQDEFTTGHPIQIIEGDKKLPNLVSPQPCFPKLESLHVDDCHKMKRLFSGSASNDLPNLHLLTIKGLDLIMIPNIREIELKGFDNARYHFKSSIASLLMLEILRIEECHRLEHIIDTDDEYGKENMKAIFPNLRELSVRDCGQLKYIGQYPVANQDYRETHIHFSPLETLHLSRLPSFVSIYATNTLTVTCPSKNYFAFLNLGKLEIIECDSLEVVFSKSVLRCLPKLNVLVIRKCKELRQIIEGDKNLSNILSPQPCFPKLEALHVDDCHMLKRLFFGSASNDLPNLLLLAINGAYELEELVGCNQGKIKVELPKLKLLIFMHLENFSQEIKLHNLKNCIVYKCPKLSLTSTTTLQKLCEDFPYKDFINTELHSSEFARIVKFIYEDNLSEKCMNFESRQSAYEKLLDAVKNNVVSMIGLYGMGGCGKTTLAMEIRKLVEAEHLFEKVIFVPVSSTVDVPKIQEKIANSLQFQLPETEEMERAQRLCSRLTEEINIFIILDNVWEKLDFGRIGIPSSKYYKGCKILITTRSEAVCSSMDCQRKIYLPILTDEEAWTLFQKKALITEATSDTLKDLGRLISNECKGLPVAIAAVACSLKRKAETVWRFALNKLRHSKPINIERGLTDPYYDCLQLSYDNLDDKEAKSLFLLCSVFPEDSEIQVELLTRCAIGLGVVGEVDSYEEARSEVIAAKIKLVSCCLLLDADGERVKMHDIVRDVAHLIAKNENKMIKCEEKKNATVEKNSVRYLWCVKFPNDLDCSNLEFLCLRTKMKEFDEIFKRMGTLKVLILVNDEYGKTRLSTISLKTLTNLRYLFIWNYELSDFSCFGSMKNLQSLSLYYCLLPSFLELQTDVTSLKLLELNKCDIKVMNFEVMKRIPLLEELYIIDIKGKYIEFFKTFSIPETLHRYAIVLGSHKFEHFNYGDVYIDGRTLLLNHFDISNEVIKGLAKKAKHLFVANIHGGAKNVIPDIFQIEGGGLDELNKLEIRDSAEINCLIDTSSLTLFSKLHTLRILEKLYLSDCPRLTSLFTYVVARSLVKLKVLKISRCDELKHIFTDEEKAEKGQDEFTSGHPVQIVQEGTLSSLASLKITYCGKLGSIFTASIAKTLTSLEELFIEDCESLKDIVTHESIVEDEHDSQSDISIFQSLKKLHISRCDLLERIFPGSFIGELNKLTNKEAADLKDFSSRNNTQIELPALQVLQLDDIRNRTIVDSYHVICPSLRTLSLDIGRYVGFFNINFLTDASEATKRDFIAIKISNSDFVPPVESLSEQPHGLNLILIHNIREIELKGFDKGRYLFKLSIASSLMMLEILRIKRCHGLEYIIDTDDEYGKENMKAIFPNLKELSVYDCFQLKYMFGQYHVANKDYKEIHIQFSALEILSLRNLPKFVSICSTNTLTVTWPSLKDFDCYNCFYPFYGSREPIMTTAKDPEGIQNHLPTLQTLNIKHSDADRIFCLNEHEMIGQQVSLRLEKMVLYNLPQMTYTWVGPNNSLTLQHLTTLEIRNCGMLEVIFPKSVVRWLPELKKVTIIKCMELKQIMEEDESNLLSIDGGSKVEEIIGYDKEASKNYFAFPNLEELEIIECAKLEVVFPKSVLRCLPKLKLLTIKECKELRQIISNLVSPQPCFPKLEALHVDDCHKLKRLFSGSASNDLPNLLLLVINGAYELEELVGCKQGMIKVELPRLKLLIFMHLENFSQEIELHNLKDCIVYKCPKLSLTSTTTLEKLSEDFPYEDFINTGLGPFEFEAIVSEFTSSQWQARNSGKPSNPSRRRVKFLDKPKRIFIVARDPKLGEDIARSQIDENSESSEDVVPDSQAVERGDGPKISLDEDSDSVDEEDEIGVVSNDHILAQRNEEPEQEFVAEDFTSEIPRIATSLTNSQTVEKPTPSNPLVDTQLTSEPSLMEQKKPLGEIPKSIEQVAVEETIAKNTNMAASSILSQSTTSKLDPTVTLLSKSHPHSEINNSQIEAHIAKEREGHPKII